MGWNELCILKMFLFNHYRHSSLMNALIKQNFKQKRKGSSQEMKKQTNPPPHLHNIRYCQTLLRFPLAELQMHITVGCLETLNRSSSSLQKEVEEEAGELRCSLSSATELINDLLHRMYSPEFSWATPSNVLEFHFI